MKSHTRPSDVWADLAAVWEVREAFGLEGTEDPEAQLSEATDAVELHFLNGSLKDAGAIYMLRGKGGVDPAALLLSRINGELQVIDGGVGPGINFPVA